MLETMQTIPLPPVDEREALRYAQGGSDEGLRLRLRACAKGVEFTPRVIYRTLEKEDFFKAVPLAKGSVSLTNLLHDCEQVVLFAATVGLDGDRLIARYSKIKPSKAICFQAIGAAQIETLCDIFCREIAEKCEEQGYRIGNRFSPGYGEFPLGRQQEIFLLLDCARRIGVTLLESGLMSPTKSVTAVFGIGKRE
jgi:hypothetical protein